MKRIFASLLFVSIGVCVYTTRAQVQTASPSSSAAATATPQATAPTKDPVTASLRMLLPRSRNNTLGAITAMPTDKFNYKPTPDQMTFAHLVVHIASSNNFLCAKVADIAEPKVEEVKETDSKDKLLAAATASFDFCGDALAKMDDSKLGDSVELFGGRRFPRAMAALGLASGWADHYAAAAQYLRLNGILPPSAQPKK
ncbi:MAG: DinB family protein [Candidatus Sulfotelmatobacter sp.]